MAGFSSSGANERKEEASVQKRYLLKNRREERRGTEDERVAERKEGASGCCQMQSEVAPIKCALRESAVRKAFSQ